MMDDIKETIYGHFAADFIEERLDRLCVSSAGIQTGPFGSQLHQEDYVTVGTPIITVEHVGENRILHEGVPHVSDPDRVRLSRYLLRAGDIVFSRVGSVDRRALVRHAEDGWLFSGRCLRVRPNTERIDSEFLSYFFGLPAFKRHIRAIAVGATMPSLNTSILSDIIILYPHDIGEQRAIAHILGTLEDKIELNRRMNETLEAMARGIFKSWFVDFNPVRAKAEGRDTGLPSEIADLFPDSFEDSVLGEIPKGWKVGSIGDIAEVSSGKRPLVRYNAVSTKASIPLWGGNGPMAYVPKPLVIYPILLTGRVGTLGSVFRLTTPCWPSDNTLILRTRNLHTFDYLYFRLREIDFTSLNRGSTQPLLTQTDLQSQILLVPTDGILAYFHSITVNFFDRVDECYKESQALAALRDTLLPKLISGELRTTPADELREKGSFIERSSDFMKVSKAEEEL